MTGNWIRKDDKVTEMKRIRLHLKPKIVYVLELIVNIFTQTKYILSYSTMVMFMVMFKQELFSTLRRAFSKF